MTRLSQSDMLKRFWSNEEGVVAPAAIMLMVVLLGFCAFVVDVGQIYATRRFLQNAADAAALAGARDVQYMVMGGAGNPASQALTWASKNGVSTAAATQCSSTTPTITYNNPKPTRNYSWQVKTSRLVPLTFGPLIGIENMCVSADAVAVVTTGSAAKVFPYSLFATAAKAIPVTAKPGTQFSCDPSRINDSSAQSTKYCFVLKEGAQGSASGNFGILDFLCTGNQQKSTNYVYWTENGFGSRAGETIPGPIPSNQWTVCTYTGNTASANNTINDWVVATLANPPQYCPKARIDPGYVADFRCPLIGLLPILKEDSLGTGSSGTVTIVNFAVFMIVGLTNDQATGHKAIVGQFLEMAATVGPSMTADPNAPLTGALTIRLVQ
jgi:Flp pilus assembly protein TadG